ncbi:MAG: ROK family protein [Candidatus Omnitrophota bacterium]
MKSKYIIGIDLGGTNLKAALCDSDFRILHKQVLSTRKFKSREKLISCIVSCVGAIIEKYGLLRSCVLGIGIGLPGPVDNKRGIVHFLPNIPGFKNVNLKAILQRRMKLPVFVDNDAKLMCLAEQSLGRAAPFENAICITLGTGVGGGLIINGKLYRGSNNASGEIGHMAINEKGPKCNCGGFACLESYVGNNRLMQDAKKGFGRHITLEELSALAKKGNKRALKIWEKAGLRLGLALSNALNLLNPEAIIIGGGVANAGGIIFDTIRKKIKEQAMRVQAKGLRVLKARLGNDAGIIGAAISVKKEIK